MKTFGEKIAELRRERGLTQENLAGIIGISSQAISKWENNATMPDIMFLPIIADTLGVTIDELFGIRHKVQKKPIGCEETPMAVYEQMHSVNRARAASTGDKLVAVGRFNDVSAQFATTAVMYDFGLGGKVLIFLHFYN